MTTETTAEPAGMPVYQLRYDTADDADTIATYDNVHAAQEHGEHCYQLGISPGGDLTWRPETPGAGALLRLYATDATGVKIATDWHIVPGMVRSTFTPVCGES